MFTKEDLDKAFELAIENSKNLETALTDSGLNNLISVINAIGNVKRDPIFETVSTALYSYLGELHNFNLAFTAVPSLMKDLKPKVEATLHRVSRYISQLRKELLAESPNHKTILEAIGNTFFEFHELFRIRSSYSTG